MRNRISALILMCLSASCMAEVNQTPDYLITSMGEYQHARELSKCVAYQSFMVDHLKGENHRILHLVYSYQQNAYFAKTLNAFAASGTPGKYVMDESRSAVSWYRSFYDKYYIQAGMLPSSKAFEMIDGCTNLLRSSV